MNQANYLWKRTKYIFLFFLMAFAFIAIIVIYIILNRPINDLYPKSNIQIKYQSPWQREFYFNRIEKFKNNPIGNNKIVFLGNSITEGGGNWNQSFSTKNIVNRGISGDHTEGILHRLDEIIFYKPIAVFLLIGINDFFKDNSNNLDINPIYVANNIIKIADIIKKDSPSTTVFIQTILPINNEYYMKIKKVDYNFLQPDYKPSINEQIKEVNSILIKNIKHRIVDLYPLFLNSENILEPKLSSDGVHLNQKGYQVWINRLSNIILELNN